MAELQIRFDDGAAYERMMGTWSRLAGDIFLDWLAPARACDGSTSAAATAPLPNCWSSAAPLPRFTVSTHPKPNWRSRASGRRRALRNLLRATPWRCRFPKTGSTPR